MVGYGVDRSMAWGGMLTYGIALIILGGLGIFHPVATAMITALVLSIFLIIGGAMALIAGLLDRSIGPRWVDIAFGGMGIVAGLIVAFAPLTAAVVLLWVVGIWLILSGVMELFAAIRSSEGRIWLLVIGLVDLFLGIWLLTMRPAGAVLTIAFIVGASFVIRGVFISLLAFRLKNRG